jgi:hypothetical protein
MQRRSGFLREKFVPATLQRRGGAGWTHVVTLNRRAKKRERKRERGARMLRERYIIIPLQRYYYYSARNIIYAIVTLLEITFAN